MALSDVSAPYTHPLAGEKLIVGLSVGDEETNFAYVPPTVISTPLLMLSALVSQSTATLKTSQSFSGKR